MLRRLALPSLLCASVMFLGCAQPSSRGWAQMGPVLEPLPAGTPLRQAAPTHDSSNVLGRPPASWPALSM